MKVFYIAKRLLSHRYTILVAPHQQGSAHSFAITLGGALGALTLWSFLTIAGFVFFVQGGALWTSWAEASLFKARVLVLQKELFRMQETARDLALAKEDMRFLMAHDGGSPAGSPMSTWGSSDRSGGKDLGPGIEWQGKPDVISALLTGKITQETLARIQQNRRAFQEQSSALLSDASGLLLDRYNRDSRDRAIPSEWPAIGALTSHYGLRFSPFHRDEESGEAHRGLDIANAQGTPIRATADGIVRKANWVTGFGRTVVLDHGYGYSSLYGHTSKIVVSEGDYVRRGDILGYMGTTGRSTGNHLHFEVWQHGRPVNPLRLVRLEKLPQVKESFAKHIETQESLSIVPAGVGGAWEEE